MPPRPGRGRSSPAPAQPRQPASAQPSQSPTPSRGRGGGGAWGARGAARGAARGGPPRGGPGGQPQGTQSQPTQQRLAVGPTSAPATSISTVGVRRRSPGVAGRRIQLFVNATEISIPDRMIYHYDITITGPSGKTDSFPPRYTHELIKQLQRDTAPEVFQPAGAYDGKKNLYMPHLLNLPGGDSATFTLPVSSAAPQAGAQARPPALFQIKVVKVQEINPEVLQRFVDGKQSQDESVLTALMAMNVAIRQDPICRGFAFNTRSFFPNTPNTPVSQPILGLQFRRGYFQSVRATIGKAILNVDITTGMFYQEGPLINLCLAHMGKPNDPMLLAPSRGLPDRVRVTLQRFISGIRVQVNSGRNDKIVSIVKLSQLSARQLTFTKRDGTTSTVADYFRQTYNRALRFPDVICGVTASGAALPLELLTVLPRQIARKQIPPDATAKMVEFSQLRPSERMAEIRAGVQLLAHGQSDYVRNFGMVPSPNFPMSLDARVINPPRLQYRGREGRGTQTVNPRNGAWNLRDITFVEPRTIERWCVVVFESPNRFPERAVQEMVGNIIQEFKNVGMTIREAQPVIHFGNAQRDISGELRQAGSRSAQKNKSGPELLVVILPDQGNTEIYRGVKHFGDIEMGVATQCLKASKCRRAKSQYWANVSLKVNPKLGGINHKPDPSSATASDLNDPRKPTIIMGADVMHPAPGSSLPSYTAVVGNVDSDVAKYISEIRVQTSRVEIIEDLGEMVRNILQKYMDYRQKIEQKQNVSPVRLLFFRDGVDEGQYQKVKDLELQIIREVCLELKIRPAITFIIVAKRHHFRFFPRDPNDPGQADNKSGNCLAGTVVDTGITHPTEFDFYLQSHGGLLGTSRSAHYHVLSDDNDFTPDAMQSLCYGLCHVFARSTRTISIPTPVAYADIVCARAPNHYKSSSAMSEIESTATGGRDTTLERMRADFKPIHRAQLTRTFFTVGVVFFVIDCFEIGWD
ncbi:Piwi-domain-containing protein [Marasmius fiardii PR-910]|nr:Piwi-domain-containing protein [Marasmius fiardii PR-910]